MCLYIGSREATQDIDAATNDGDANIEAVETLRTYADKMSVLFNLPSGWLHSGGNMYITEPMKKTAVRAFEMSNLVVNFLNWKSMLVLKIIAFREQPDITDSVAILRKYNIRSADDIYKWIQELKPEWIYIHGRPCCLIRQTGVLNHMKRMF